MNDYIQDVLIGSMRMRGYTLEEARNEAIRGLRPNMPDAMTVVGEAVEAILEKAKTVRVIERLPGVVAPEVQQDLREGAWYTGPLDTDPIWGGLKSRLLRSGLAAAVPDIDASSSKVVGHLAQPRVKNLKKKGLVLGYVQSGKTANYTAVMAKAADAGYKTFIVLSGMHNNLRKQTQARIDRDLQTLSANWLRLTTTDADFGAVVDGNALVANGVRSVAVVKKNATRLTNLRDWLRGIDPALRSRSPILIIDDEADQATPNSLAAKDLQSAINRLLREIWAEVNNGTYVGYTATPFANIFMDPDDETELYPSDFIFDLPQSENYFGAERLFGRNALDDADEPDSGLNVVRSIPEDEAESLKPPAAKAVRANFDPPIPDSLVEAVRWFLIATAIRRTRGQEQEHSSMLVHTTAYVRPHFVMQDRLNELLASLQDELLTREQIWAEQFASEVRAVGGLNDFPRPAWEDIRAELPQVLLDARVVVDNGLSDDRLDYDREDGDGNPIAEVVIAVGGSTLSRGLTLEGLVVSYFVRSASTYDTLLQMGRWFGFRAGYEDLPRIWVTDDLMSEFSFLALVEEELRRDMRRLEALNVTPQQFGVRVRAHPGRLSITSRNKMVHADLVRVDYAGQRHQTIVLHETESEILRHNLNSARELLKWCVSQSPRRGEARPTLTQFYDVPGTVISDFIDGFHFHPDQPGLRKDHLVGWLRTAAPEINWNIAVLASGRPLKKDGRTIPLGEVDLGLGYPIPMVNRSALRTPGPGVANIKGLLSRPDWLADFPPESVPSKVLSTAEYQQRRSSEGDGNGLLIIYVISPHSLPIRATQEHSRRALEAEEPIVALGFVFPEPDTTAGHIEGNYYSVRPDWTMTMDEIEDEVPGDTEDSREITAADIEGLIN